MKQEYHSNAVTNVHIRKQIKASNLTNLELSATYATSTNTISKWRNSKTFEDRSSRPNKIVYALDEITKGLAISIRRTTWIALDEVWEAVLEIEPKISRSSIYRTFCREGINNVPEEEKEKCKKFKEYEPGFLHMDVTYLPKIDGIKYYLFVAIDRATRMLYYKVYDAKTSENAEDFMNKCLTFFPFEITHVLTDNGFEFTNTTHRSIKGNACEKNSRLDLVCLEKNIQHRLTKRNTPQTNGMVERVNGIIKKGTILKEDYNNLEEMEKGLMTFLQYYILYKRHGSLRKELNVKTPFMAIEKWFELKPELFNQSPLVFKTKILDLNNVDKLCLHQQPCET